MKTCPFCAEEIQDAAIVCKHCGRDLQATPAQPAAKPAKPPVSNSTGCLAGILATLFFVGWCAYQGSSPTTPTSTSAAPQRTDAECKAELKCWAEKSMVNADVYCKRPVERMAKNNFEWTDGFLERKFSHYKWKNQAAGQVTYVGDKIKFQNGFGAWTYYTYECDLGADGQTVLGVRATPGRLGQ